MVRKILLLCTLGLILLISFPLQAQNINQQDFSKIKVDELTDAQIRQLIRQAEATGMGEDQLTNIATSRGMDPAEVQKLRVRVEQLKRSSDQPTTPRRTPRSVNSDDIDDDDQRSSKVEKKTDPRIDSIRALIFGASLFNNTTITFEPNLRLATPSDYQIGPDDEILIDIYGHSEASYQLKVTPDGTINIPLAGVVTVSGASMEQASSRIRAKLSNIYSGIRNGTTSVNISLGNIRSIKVVLTGEIVQPGTYTLPSVATVFNALYASGGPTENGSFRQIQVIRAGETIATLDIYDFLLYGSLKNNVRLQDQDVVRVPTYKTRVEVKGQTKRNGIFEMKYGETFSDLLRFAGDFNERAYKARVKVLKNTETEHQIEDVTSDLFDSYQPSSGDQYFVDEILERFKNRVTINGAVFRPGQYELNSGLTLQGLIMKAEGLKEDAFLTRGYILRIKNNLTSEMVSFNPGNILSGKDADISLKREDVVNIPSIFDLKEEYNLTISGEIRSPGVYNYAENTRLEDLIVQAGGFKEGATPTRIEISRRIRNSGPTTDTTRIAQVFHINVDKDLSLRDKGFILMPYDIVDVRASPGYQVQRTVQIQGEVVYPGNYTVESENERISDLIRRAGGLTRFAYQEGASLKRVGKRKTLLEQEKENLKVEQFENLQKKAADSSMVDIKSTVSRNDYVGIELPRIIEHPGQRYDLLLEDGDIINIPKQLQTVKISGEVLTPSSVVYIPSVNFKRYILQSGGFSAKALKKRSYIIYANGSVASTRKFLFFNNYPEVKPGSEIFVPEKDERRNNLSTTEIVAITTGLATIATLVFTILR
jgi:protein involved in polysaccharide export with SLBB domain